MYSRLYQFARHYLWRGNSQIRRSLRALKYTEWLSPSQLEEIQLKNIQRLVKYAYENVPFYRARYQREDIHPYDIKTLKDFQALPFLTRDDVINNQEGLLSTVYQGRTFSDTTGGSTGQPMRFIMDSIAAYDSYAVEARCRGWYGVRPGFKMAWIWGNIKDFPGWKWRDRLIAHLMNQRYLNSRTMDETTMDEFALMLLKWQPAMLKAYPSALAIFADYLKEKGYLKIRPRLIEVGGEKTTPDQLQLFKDVFHAPVADYYGGWESGVISYKCPAGSIHVMENRYLETVSGNQVLPRGQVGEIVVTPLNQYAMPFIRYKNDDLGIIEPTNCTCGRSMPVLREIVGRNSDLLVNTDGRVVHWSSLYTIMRGKPEVFRYQLYQPDRGHLELRLVSTQKLETKYLEDIRKELQPCFGEDMNISIMVVDHIELTPAGKHRFIISDVKSDSLK